ncbi:dynein axonemal heavy chain 7 isoform X2 [Daphnia magna]|nr:dynein axonemal heavy chain 7 isoform X2 [Daphnia magna]
MDEILTIEEPSIEECIPAIIDIRSRMKQVSRLWEIEPHQRLWFLNSELKNVMLSRLTYNKTRLEECLLGQYRKETNRLLAELDRMKKQILQPPSNTMELLGRSAYLEEARNKPLNDLIASMTALKGLFVRLTDIVTYTDADVIRSSQAFFGPDEIVPMLDDGTELIAKYRRQFEDRYQEVLEKTQKDLKRLKIKMKHFNNCGDWDSVEYYVKDITAMSRKVQEIQRTANWITQEEIQLKYPITSFPEIAEINTYIEPYIRLYVSINSWRKLLKRWLDGDFHNLNADDIENQTDEMSREMFRLQKVFRARGKQLEVGNAQSRKANEGANQMGASLKMCQRGLDDVKEFKVQLPIVGVICNPGLRDRHWKDMSDLVAKDLKPNTGTTLRKFLNLGLMPYLEKFEVISGAASKEFSLEKGMKSMAEEWNVVVFSTAKYRDTDTPILAGVDEIQALLDDHLIKTQTMKGSPFVRPVEKQLLAWEGTLLRIQQTIEEWLIVQSQWLYLDPIFSSPNIIDQMPDEATLFKNVDAIWHGVMGALVSNPNVMQTAGSVGMLEQLAHSSKLLEQINFGVNAYLDKKRLYFSRFFFLSNEEMLDILSETKDPLRVQTHLKKVFEGIASLEFDEDYVIHAMISPQGERVPFVNPVKTADARGSVEVWLLQVEDAMIDACRHIIQQSLRTCVESSRHDWVAKTPGQAVLCAAQVQWAAGITHAIIQGPKALKQYYQDICTKLNESASLVKMPLAKLTRTTLGALVVTEVHTRDLVQELIENNVTDINNFSWISQLRYYSDENNEIIVRMINATLKYAYEYLGNTSRLVITPLTDRCYRTLIGAYHLHLSGAPEGPAGTGKTETTKDLAKALAVQCLVFNCSDGLDYVAMGKFFRGLASSGAWACFDEFNRIEAEVLSVVAQQMLSILHAIQSHMKTFIFEGVELKLNPMCFVCVTMNPGYAGRSELPDNLRVLFRTVAMMIPDYSMIGEISLYSYGFTDARNLATKIVTTYKLCSEQLSTQSHYDYGMRAVKSVLVAAGNLKVQSPSDAEDSLILRSLMDVNLPKFLSGDLILFHGIIADLFPEIPLPQSKHSALLAAIQQACDERDLLLTDKFAQKVIQMYEMMLVRHGFMLVGRPMGGKSTVIQVLASALNFLSLEDNDETGVIYRTLNPKAVTPGLLFGQFDPVTHEWVDGIVSLIFRELSTSESNARKWIIFDGPVDAVWIENLNTVLDDNKKLCLASGEIIGLTPSMSCIFEVMDLAQASPATVSRCGMVYVDPGDLGWQPLFHTWLKSFTANWKAALEPVLVSLIQWLIPASLSGIRKFGVELLNVEENSKVSFLLRMVQALMQRCCAGLKDVRYGRAWLQASILFALTWTIGGALESESQIKFDTFIRSLLSGKSEAFPYPTSAGRWECHLPSDGTLYDYVYEYKQRGQWRQWAETVRNIPIPDAKSLRELTIPTVDTARYSYLLDLSLASRTPILLVGPTGTGKSLCIQEKMSGFSDEEFASLCLTFTAQTSAAQVQDLILSRLERRKKGTYGPPAGRRCLIFVDDLNMPAKETYGAQPSLELLRQYFDYHQWYDRKEANLLDIQDLQIWGAMGPPGGSRQEISPRCLRHFHIIAINPFSDSTMTHIFSTILTIHLSKGGFPPDVFSLVGSIVSATLEIYRAALRVLLPTPSKAHYVFSLRDFARVIHGCCLIQKDAVENRKTFLRLWIHEVLRVFGDRLVDENDTNWLYNMLRECVRTHFRENFDSLLEHLGRTDGRVTLASLENLMFGDYTVADLLQEDRIYKEVTDIPRLDSVIMSYITDYNNTNKTRLNLILFQYVLKHLSRISRVLRISGGHALLIGVGGSGRQSLTKLAASMAGYTLFQPTAKPNYGINEWREDVKRVLRTAGGLGRDVVFLILDSQLNNAAFLQDIDSMLNSGLVPNIFSVEEKQELIELVRKNRQSAPQMESSPASLMTYFAQQCKDHLHLVLAYSPLGSSLRDSVRYFPSLINCCTIDWFEAWPEEALENVAVSTVETIEIPAETKRKVVVACKYFHMTATKYANMFTLKLGRPVYVTPASYLSLLAGFSNLMSEQQQQIRQAIERYRNGLSRLAEASAQVNQMQIELSELQPKLVEASKQTDLMMKTIQQESGEVEKTSTLIRADEVAANEEAAISQALKAECEADLAEALPALEAALAALDTLKPADITLVKSMKNPPKVIKTVMAAVCVMKDIKPEKILDPDGSGKKILDFWGPSKKLLNDLGFLTQLKEYKKDTIPPHIMQRIRTEFLPNPDFEPSVVAKASSAAEGLCKWVKAIEIYDKTAKIVMPKKARLASAEASLEETMNLLNLKRNQLAVLEARLAQLKDDYAEGCRKRQQLSDDVDMCSKRLSRASALIGGLGTERERWSEAEIKLMDKLENLTGDIMLSAAVMAYLGPLTSAFRDKCTADWVQFTTNLGIPCSARFSLSETLGSAVRIEGWTESGLPRDSFSIDNAVMVYHQKKWPLLIDPQGQANAWLKSWEVDRGLVILRAGQADLLRQLEQTIPSGRPVLIEEVGEELDPSLDPLLSRSIQKQGGVEMIQLGDGMVEYHRDFQLYMTSKLRNPHFLPEVTTKVLVINAAITLKGLEDQLLGIVVAEERPDLEEMRQKLVKEGAACRTALQEVEDQILATLSKGGNLLEDEAAIRVLDESKVLSAEIVTKQQLAAETSIRMEQSRQAYMPVAQHAAVLFFCLAELINLSPMYQYSLKWFIRLFLFSIRNSIRPERVEERLDILQNHFDRALYTNVCRSLFEKDKLPFSMALTSSLMIQRGEMSAAEIDLFLTGSKSLTRGVAAECPEWLSLKTWDQICQLSTEPPFIDVNFSLMRQGDHWQSVADAINPYEMELPEDWKMKWKPFQRLLFLRYLAPSKIVRMVRTFVAEQLGEEFVQPPPFDLSCSFADSDSTTPLIFLLTAGADPMACLLRFAEEHRAGDGTLHIVSLGQGQGVLAEEKIQQAIGSGEWVILQNCHLAASWMPALERICQKLSSQSLHPSFRLWLTSYPWESFPVSILQNGVKITNEPPVGLKENVLRTFNPDPLDDLVQQQDQLNWPSHKMLTLRKLSYSLCFFHALVQERRTYGAIGWNIPYAFDDSDLQISLKQIRIFVTDYEQVPYQALQYLVGECHYGGRVTDDWDRRTLSTLLADFCNPELVENPNYSLVQPVHPLYILPHSADYEFFLEAVQRLPVLQAPNVFGMHENVTIGRDLLEGDYLLSSLLALQGCYSSGIDESGDGEQTSGEEIQEDSAEKAQQQSAPAPPVSSQKKPTDAILNEMIQDLIQQLPESFDLDLAEEKFPINYLQPLNTVLVQEMGRYNRLVGIIRTNLGSLQRAVCGHVTMTAELESTGKALLSNRVPAVWKTASYPSLKPMRGYFSDLLERLQFFRSWYEDGQPVIFWLPAFYFPQSFLTGALQTTARKKRIPVDCLYHHCRVMSPQKVGNLDTPPEEGVYVRGLYLVGARWDGDEESLTEQRPKVLWEEMPVLWLNPSEHLKGNNKQVANQPDESRETYTCPLYRTSERRGELSTTGHSTNFVMSLELPTKIPHSHWIKRGVALITQSDD